MQLTGNSDILTDLGQFIRNLFQDMTSGLLFFGGPLDIVIAVGDILATSLVIYYVLKLLRDSRAWQLLKGLFLILAFALVCSLIGLNTVGFLLNNTISVLAIAFVVIFQPELRRALETVGRNSFNVFTSAVGQDEKGKSAGSVHNLIEAIVRACEKMAETRTGALIIIERQTRLGELAVQENVVNLDAAVSATVLLQIFYKGSPLHDGAVLIREGRLAAARVHVPLSDNYHLRRDYGTRHRAAIGASEMGDTIAVVVSEERGVISLALEGRLYSLDNGDALRALLHKLLSAPKSPVSFVGSLLRGVRGKRPAAETAEGEQNPSDVDSIVNDVPKQAPVKRPSAGRRRLLLASVSLVMAVVLWLYVQVTINPIETRSFTVPLSYEGILEAESKGFELQYPLQNVQVTLLGRRKAISNLTDSDVRAYLDFSQVDSVGLIRLAVQVDTGGFQYIRTENRSPATVTVSVREKDDP